MWSVGWVRAVILQKLEPQMNPQPNTVTPTTPTLTTRGGWMAYARLVRLDKPIGTLLLLWPTLWALWIASEGVPDPTKLLIFCIGTLLMRSAGCAINDYADRHVDGAVERTRDRPLATGEIQPRRALLVAALLALMAFIPVLLWLNTLTQMLSILAVCIAASYPFTKRFFVMPQAYLGVAFGFGIPLAFAAVLATLPVICFWMMFANVCWAIAYDTAYAMVDRDDDIKIGIKTSAITFGRYEVTAIVTCYILFFAIMAFLANQENLNIWFWIGWIGAILCAVYHYTLVRTRDRIKCFAAFNHNNWLGAILFLGVAFAYYWK
jgi:4-hydroxybenzoate polyprenyltransferase